MHLAAAALETTNKPECNSSISTKINSNNKHASSHKAHYRLISIPILRVIIHLCTGATNEHSQAGSQYGAQPLFANLVYYSMSKITRCERRAAAVREAGKEQ